MPANGLQSGGAQRATVSEVQLSLSKRIHRECSVPVATNNGEASPLDCGTARTAGLGRTSKLVADSPQKVLAVDLVGRGLDSLW